MVVSVWDVGRSLIRMLLVTLMGEQISVDYHQQEPLRAAYDFIVVGAGSSGSVLAARLSEVPHWEVLVLEAGGAPPPESAVPGLNLLLLGSDADWGYRLEPQLHAQFSYEHNSSLYPRGRGVGGTSLMDYMQYVRGNRKDYDHWATLGNRGWDYESLLPYFKKSEDFTGSLNNDNEGLRGHGGPMKVHKKSWSTPLQEAFLQAGQEIGYAEVDPNGFGQIGFASLDLTTKDGKRQTAANAFLDPILGRKNLHIHTNCHVIKVIFDSKKRAVAVRVFDSNYNEEREVFAGREILLSAGAINSPQILMLSGVGPAQHLQEHKIPLVADVPGVGRNLQDHPAVQGLTWRVKEGSADNPVFLLDPLTIANYNIFKQGQLTVPYGIECSAFLSIGEGADPSWPDIALSMTASHPGIDNGLQIASLLGLKRRVFGRYYTPLLGREGFSIIPTLLHPRSRGTVTLRSDLPKDPPVIDPNFLSDPRDVEDLILGVKAALLVGDTTELKRTFGAKFHDKPLPDCEEIEFKSDNYWRCFVRHMTSPAYHPAGTCKMASESDFYGVVNSRLKVREVSALRVVDASVMPVIPSGGLNAACLAIAEKAADIIKEDWGIRA